MSTQAKHLKDVPSIDIGADTPILALDSSGAVGKGTLPEARWQREHEAPITTTSEGQWWRIADIDRSCVGMVAIKEVWSYSRPTPLLLAVAADCFGDDAGMQEIKVLAGNSNRIPKMRIVVDEFNSGWGAHLDMLVQSKDSYGARGTTISVCGLGLRAAAIAEAPDVSSANSVYEFTLTNSGGGNILHCRWTLPCKLQGERRAA